MKFKRILTLILSLVFIFGMSMPVSFASVKYHLSIDSKDHGDAAVDNTGTGNSYQYAPGTTVNITLTPKAGYYVSGYTVEKKSPWETVTSKSFDMSSAEAVTFSLVMDMDYQVTPEFAKYIIPGGDVAAVYVDHFNNTLATSVVFHGNVSDTYTTSAKDIAHYTLTATPDNAAGTFTLAPQTVTYVYAPIMGSVTAKYVDESNNTLADPVTTTGQEGSKYSTSSVTINGYFLKSMPGNLEGIYSNSEIVVTYVYAPIPEGSVIIRFVDQGGNDIATSVTQTGDVETEYTTTPAAIYGYTFDGNTPGNASCFYSVDPIIVTYAYNPIMADVITAYVDEEGNSIGTSDTQTGRVGTDYTTSPRDFVGYEPKETPGNASGKFTEGTVTVTYVYSEVIGKVIVKFEDSAGNSIREDDEITDRVGTLYGYEAPVIDGYTLAVTPENSNGEIGTEPQTVTFIYTKNEVTQEPETPGTPETPTTPSGPSVTQVTLTINVNGPGSVLPGSGSFDDGSVVVMNVTANPGAHFARWEGPNGGEVSDNRIQMTGSKSITAVFEEDAVQLQETETPQSGDINENNATNENNDSNNDQVVLDEAVPQATPELPKTGGIPVELLMGLGALMTTGGFAIKRNGNKKEK